MGDLLPIDESTLLDFLTHLREKQFKASTLNNHVAALGTLCEWVGMPRPRTSTVAYVLRGEAQEDRHLQPPQKARVPFFPLA